LDTVLELMWTVHRKAYIPPTRVDIDI